MVPVGTIFTDRDGGYWKVTGPKRKSIGGESYPVIKCSKHGKEFTQTNGFSCRYVDDLFNDGKTWAANSNTKVRTEGQALGAMKRRITHLESRIAADTAELAKLFEQLNQSC